MFYPFHYEIKSDFETLISSDVSFSEIDLPFFHLNKSDLLDFDEDFSASDSDLSELRQKLEETVTKDKHYRTTVMAFSLFSKMVQNAKY